MRRRWVAQCHWPSGQGFAMSCRLCSCNCNCTGVGIHMVCVCGALRCIWLPDVQGRSFDCARPSPGPQHAPNCVCLPLGPSRVAVPLCGAMSGEVRSMGSVGEPRLEVCSSTEILNAGRTALISHEVASRPLHVFGDILRRVPAPQRKAMQDCLAEAQAESEAVSGGPQEGRDANTVMQEIRACQPPASWLLLST